MLMGFREGQLIIIGARPAVGKTSFALNLALNAAAAGYTVGFFSLEMSGKEIAQRLICAYAMISISDFRMGRISPEQWANINEATQTLSKLDILIDDTPGTTVTEIRAKSRRMLHNKEKAIIILDYLQLVSPPPGRRSESRTVEVSEMSRGLKIMAKELKIPLIALSQLSRQVESRTGKRRSFPTFVNRAPSNRTPISLCSWTAPPTRPRPRATIDPTRALRVSSWPRTVRARSATST